MSEKVITADGFAEGAALTAAALGFTSFGGQGTVMATTVRPPNGDSAILYTPVSGQVRQGIYTFPGATNQMALRFTRRRATNMSATSEITRIYAGTQNTLSIRPILDGRISVSAPLATGPGPIVWTSTGTVPLDQDVVYVLWEKVNTTTATSGQFRLELYLASDLTTPLAGLSSGLITLNLGTALLTGVQLFRPATSTDTGPEVWDSIRIRTSTDANGPDTDPWLPRRRQFFFESGRVESLYYITPAGVTTKVALFSGTTLVLGDGNDATNPFVPAPDLRVGVDEPTETNVGAGIVRPLNSTPVNGNVTVPDGTVYADRIINGFVTLEGTGKIDNCEVRGPLTEPTASTSLIRTSTATPNMDVPNITNVTIKPNVASAYTNGIGNKNYYAYKTRIEGVVDGFGAFSQTADGLVNVRISACMVSKLVQFRPDYANKNSTYPDGRPETHNDGLQMQGNLGGADDILIEGSSFHARHHPTWGTQPTTYTQLANLMVSPNTQSTVSYTSRNNWYRGGVNSINAGSANAESVIIHDGDRFERIGAISPGPAKSISINGAASYTVTNCVDFQGATVQRVAG